MERDVETLTTRVFNNGNSQAVRIPAEFRLDTDRVSISRNESGDLVIHPLRAERGAALLDALRAVGEADLAFVAALEAEQAASMVIARIASAGTRNRRWRIGREAFVMSSGYVGAVDQGDQRHPRRTYSRYER